MKTDQQIKTLVVIISTFIIGTLFVTNKSVFNKTYTTNDLLLADNILNASSIAQDKIDENTTDENNEIEVEEIDPIVYDGLTKQQLVDKLNRNLNSTLAGYGESFANYSLELGIDPYLAVAIVLHETGCSWDCSSLVKYCYNVGGQKGNPGCNGGSYAAFSSLDEGIRRFMYNLHDNFYAYGLTTAETINKKYAENPTWYVSINKYIDKIKAS